MNVDPDKDRGIHYADGGYGPMRVFYPDPERMRRINEEWAMIDKENAS